MLAFNEKIIKIVYSVKLPLDWLTFEQTERHATAAAFNIHMIYYTLYTRDMASTRIRK